MFDARMKVMTDGAEHLDGYPFKLWWVPQVPMEAFEVMCSDLETAVGLKDVLALYDLFQFEHKVKPDYCNMGGVSAWSDTGRAWVSIDDDIDDLLAGTLQLSEVL